MFCKNCGREIDRKTLEKLMKPSGETALCPNCGKELDTAEFCGGFWGLIASGQAMNAGAGGEAEKAGLSGEAKNTRPSGRSKSPRLSGVTEADRLFARMILESDGEAEGSAGADAAGAAALTGGTAALAGAGRAYSDSSAGNRSDRKASQKKEPEAQTPDKPDKPDKGSGKAGREKRGRGPGPAGAVILAAAVLAGFVFGRVLPASGGRGAEAGSESAQTAEAPDSGVRDADAESLAMSDDNTTDGSGGQDADQTGDSPDAAGGTPGQEDAAGAVEGTEENPTDAAAGEADRGDGTGTDPEAVSGEKIDSAGTDSGKYNMIRRTSTEVDGMMIEDTVMYLGTRDSGVLFDGENLKNEWLASAGETSYVRTSVRESDGLLQEIQQVFYDKKGQETNNSSGYSRVKYEYDSQGTLEKKKYYAMTEGQEKDIKICTSECAVVETEDGHVSLEIFDPSEAAADLAAFHFRKVERSFEPDGSALPGALGTVRYYLNETDTEAATEEIHEYSREDADSSEEEGQNYDYYVRETITKIVRGPAGEYTASDTQEAADEDADTAAGTREMSQSGFTAAAGESAGDAFGGTSEEASEESTAGDTQESADGGTYAGPAQETGSAVITDRTVIRYYFAEDDDRPELVRMGYYQDDRSVVGEAGFSCFTRVRSLDGTVEEDTFYVNSGADSEEDGTAPALLGSEDPLLSGGSMPGYYPAENPWMFRIP